MTYVYLVIHQKLPTYSMYFRDDAYSEPIETVNKDVVGIYKTEDEALKQAKKLFFTKLGHTDNGESENGGYYAAAYDMTDSDSGTWDEEVYVEPMLLK
jgi:hypothetical protein